jgi:adenylosuccinate synthase
VFFHDKPSIIGPDCVVHVKKFLQEVAYLEENGFDPLLVKIHPSAHIITDTHIQYDQSTLNRGWERRGRALPRAMPTKPTAVESQWAA